MREIKFRGQTRKKGEKVRIDGTPVEGNWVYGGVRQGKGDFSMIYENETYEKRTVYTDTVCQYIGLKDKNGKEIYEGDILRGEFYGYPFDCIETFTVKWHKADAGFLANYFNNAKCKVIGNIFDNPELLDADKQASKYADNDVMKPAT